MTELTVFERKKLFEIEKDLKVLEIKNNIAAALKHILLNRRKGIKDAERVFTFYKPLLLTVDTIEFESTKQEKQQLKKLNEVHGGFLDRLLSLLN